VVEAPLTPAPVTALPSSEEEEEEALLPPLEDEDDDESSEGVEVVTFGGE
jgi:hypothetical protein